MEHDSRRSKGFGWFWIEVVLGETTTKTEGESRPGFGGPGPRIPASADLAGWVGLGGERAGWGTVFLPEIWGQMFDLWPGRWHEEQGRFSYSTVTPMDSPPSRSIQMRDGRSLPRSTSIKIRAKERSF